MTALSRGSRSIKPVQVSEGAHFLVMKVTGGQVAKRLFVDQDVDVPPRVTSRRQVCGDLILCLFQKYVHPHPQVSQTPFCPERVYLVIDTRPTRLLILAQHVLFLLARPTSLRPGQQLREALPRLESSQSQFSRLSRIPSETCGLKPLPQDDRASRSAYCQASRCSINSS
jgi:hypothetical protein